MLSPFSNQDPFVEPLTLNQGRKMHDEETATNFLEPANNVLLQAAMPILALITAINNTPECAYANELRNKAIEQFKYFELRIEEGSYPTRSIMAARYCLATAVDEAILKTVWGKNSVWLQQGVLGILHQDSNGGEKFYTILDTFSAQPKANKHLLELLYFILSLGFAGKFYNNKEKLNDIRDHLFRAIASFKNQTSSFLQSEMVHKPKLPHYKPSISMLIVLASGILFTTILMMSEYSRKNLENVTAILHDSVKEFSLGAPQ